MKLFLLVVALLTTTSLKAQDIPKFTDIVEIWENHPGYYLTKSGRIVGRDSLFFFDNGPDCESEGFIRFRNKVADKVGMFDAKGNVAIPAEYDVLSKAMNGVVIALKGATKDDDEEHPSWSGGRTMLIDVKNNVLIDDFDEPRTLNYYSLQKSPKSSADPLRKSYKSTDGQYYTFIDYDLEFKKWVMSELLPKLTKKSLLNATSDKVKYQDKEGNRFEISKDVFIEKNFEILKSKLKSLELSTTDYDISIDMFTILSAIPANDIYYNNCGETKGWQFPVGSIVITHRENGRIMKQDHIDFLRTSNGYKLIDVTIRN